MAIETEIWGPIEGKPQYVEFKKHRKAAEVFADIRAHLEGMGYLPDEYFLLDSDWENGKNFPRDGYIHQSVDFGASEGIYLDGYISWEDKDHKPQRSHFFTGKTLGEGAEDMNRMNLISSAITLALRTNGAQSRYAMLNNASKSDGLTVHFTGPEQKWLAEQMLEVRNQLQKDGQPVENAEKVLRKLVGSISEYMMFVGVKPQGMTPEDRAMLAIQESNLPAFHEAFTEMHKSDESLDMLLLAAAGQRGRVAYEMVNHILRYHEGPDPDVYVAACKRAVDLDDMEKVKCMTPTPYPLEEKLPNLYGEVLEYAYSYCRAGDGAGKEIASELLNQAHPGAIKTIPCRVVSAAVERDDYDFAKKLLDKGVPVKERGYEGPLFFVAAKKEADWFIKSRLMDKYEFDIDANNSQALHLCKNTGNAAAAISLIDCGADYEAFAASLKGEVFSEAEQQFMFETKDHYDAKLALKEK